MAAAKHVPRGDRERDLWLHFWTPREDHDGFFIGPFRWVQATYGMLRASDHFEGGPTAAIAYYSASDGDWFLRRRVADILGVDEGPWSDWAVGMGQPEHLALIMDLTDEPLDRFEAEAEDEGEGESEDED